MIGARLMRTIRDRYHPLFHLRRLQPARAALAALDRPRWVSLAGIAHPVRVRAVSHLSYALLDRSPEPEVAKLLRALARLLSPRGFWDVGANFGYYTWLLRSLVPGIAVVMVEPEPANLALIEATLRAAGGDGVQLVAAAASSVAGTARFERDLVSGATGSLQSGWSFAQRHWGREKTTTEVRVVTLDELAEFGPADVLKLDVEGHEAAVLAGATRLLDRDQPVVIYESFSGPGAPAELLRARGYLVTAAAETDAGLDGGTEFLALPPQHVNRLNELRAGVRRERA